MEHGGENMDYISHEEVSSVTLFKLRLSEGELMVYENCINFVLSNCEEEKIYDLIGCADKEELRSFQKDLVTLIKKYVREEYLSERLTGDGSL